MHVASMNVARLNIISTLVNAKHNIVSSRLVFIDSIDICILGFDISLILDSMLFSFFVIWLFDSSLFL